MPQEGGSFASHHINQLKALKKTLVFSGYPRKKVGSQTFYCFFAVVGFLGSLLGTLCRCFCRVWLFHNSVSIFSTVWIHRVRLPINPARGHKGSSHLSPVHALRFFYRDASSALLQLVNQWLNFTYSRSHAFRYERKNTNPTLVRIELTTSALAGVQVTY